MIHLHKIVFELKVILNVTLIFLVTTFVDLTIGHT